ncbi:DUF2690 domain-containing protein [Streptomyces ferrugineus]|uniref:DUF2690 domain-containing protein n=1 Tax=Streptomyces ferrugineus TaxID=1413221 RepID=A0A7M2SZ44_9ACTN|nr:DUF2690 domain-containing protein [Streptomyces ferrugineus]QOV40843.1 DUF2690 domain-containing protein [Streptomyces ferrugineus]
MARARLAIAAASLTLAAGSLALAPTATAAEQAPTGGCWNWGCEGKNPAAYCGGDARTVDSLRLGGRNGALLELRYSPSCEAIWARLSDAAFDEINAKAGDAKVVRNGSGKDYWCQVPVNGSSCYTEMLADHNMTAYAWGDYDTSIHYYKGRTGSY